MDFLTPLLQFIAAMLAGGVNAVAGGGTVISFPAAALSVPLIVANATNAFALVPASLGSVTAYRDDLGDQRRVLILLLIPTILGALAGAWVVANTPEAIFRRVVPFLILFAVVLFAFSKRINAFLQRTNAGRTTQQRQTQTSDVKHQTAHPELVEGSNTAAPAPLHSPLSTSATLFAGIVQFVIALYGGYFGAGIGILMLSSLSLAGMRDIHRMNALKAALAAGINSTAVVFFALSGRIHWPLGLWMAVGALIGGYVMARLAKRINQNILRAFVVVMGIVAALYMFARA
jgi:uncharacterized membrane protein YfcA